MATISIDSKDLCGYGLPELTSAYGTILRQKVDCTKTPLTGSEVYAIYKIPQGFVARTVVVNVVTETATGGVTLSVGSNQKNSGGSQIVYVANLAATTAKATLLDVELPTIAVADTVGTPTSGKVLADDDSYLVIIPSANINDMVFEVSIAGDFMLDPVDARD